jgi:hypothetical protein
MIEREKQRTDQEKKHKEEKQRRSHSEKKREGRQEQRKAGKSTDPETMLDKGYVERIEEKTEEQH